MREIKFRAWDKSTKKIIDWEWLEIYKDGARIVDVEGFMPDCELELMQYTGLKDKNGKEIYEGDIVKYNKKTITYIRFFEEYGMYCLVAKTRDGKEYADGHGGSSTRYSPYILSEYHRKRIEIIGNIYQNKELLK